MTEKWRTERFLIFLSSKTPGQKVRVNFKGKDRLEFRNVAGKRKYLMPEDVAFSPDSSNTYPILRHFFDNNNDNLVFEGVSYNWLISQPPGTIVLDPTVAINDSTEDTYIANGSATNYGASQDLLVGRQMTNTDWKRMRIKFERKTGVSWTSNGVNLGADAAATPEGSQVWHNEYNT